MAALYIVQQFFLLLLLGHLPPLIWPAIPPIPVKVPLSQLLHSIQGPVPLCSPDSIGLLLPNPAPQGPTQLYANRHRHSQPICSQPFPPGSPLLRLDVQLLFDFPCGVRSRRMTAPRTGLEHSLRIILGTSSSGNAQNGSANSGQQQRIFDVRCQYFADRNQTIGRVLELTAMSGTLLVEESPNLARPPGKLVGQQQPECKYSIHSNSVDGPQAERVSLGDRVFHRWRCGDEFALKVYRCFVHDGHAKKHQIINERGCSTDLSVMPHPMYSANLSAAVAPSRVFRFSSSARIFFDCLLYACLKSDPECRRATLPRCHNSRQSSAIARRRRRRRRGIEGAESANFAVDQMAAPRIESVGVRLETGDDRVDQQKLSERQLRYALERSQKAVKALVLLNIISLITAILLGCTLCCQQGRRFNTRLAISQRPRR